MRLQLPPGSHAGLIFDCDGTLVDSMPLHHQAWCRAFAEHGASFEFGWELFMSRAGLGLHQTVVELNQQFSNHLDPVEVVASQRAHYTQLIDRVTPIEEVVEVARAHRGRVPMSVASGGEKPMVLRALEVIGIREWFDHVVCQIDVERGKPHPDMFLECARRMGVTPKQCLVFEDGEPGLDAARAANMAWVAVDGSERCGTPEP